MTMLTRVSNHMRWLGGPKMPILFMFRVKNDDVKVGRWPKRAKLCT